MNIKRLLITRWCPLYRAFYRDGLVAYEHSVSIRALDNSKIATLATRYFCRRAQKIVRGGTLRMLVKREIPPSSAGFAIIVI
jgi:hypothetical protein